MRTQLASCLLIVMAGAALARGQGGTVGALSPSKTNAARLRWIQYSMVAGRVTAASAYQGTNMTLGPLTSDGRRERLQIQINPGRINLRYDLTVGDEELFIVLVGVNQFTIRRTRTAPHYELRFEQTRDEALQLEVVDGDLHRQLSGDSFWHLYLADPELVRRHLVPLLEILHPSWQLAAAGAAIEDALVQRAQRPRTPAAQRWGQLVVALASPKFSERENAQRELTQAGPVVVPFLQSLDRSRLDAEQIARIRATVEALSIDNVDTSDRAATWLAGDERVWLSLLDRGDPLKRRVAAEELGNLLGAPIDFDPAADEPTRAASLERLRARLEKPPAIQRD
jgi:hypothetical protein